MSIEQIILLLCLVIILILAGYKWFRNPTRDNVFFFAALIFLTTVLYSVTVLDLRITGSNVSLEKIETARTQVVATKDEIAKIAGLVIKSAFVLSDGSSRFGGTPQEHKTKLEEYASQLAALTKQNPGQLMDEVKSTLDQLNKSIEQRRQSPTK